MSEFQKLPYVFAKMFLLKCCFVNDVEMENDDKSMAKVKIDLSAFARFMGQTARPYCSCGRVTILVKEIHYNLEEHRCTPFCQKVWRIVDIVLSLTAFFTMSVYNPTNTDGQYNANRMLFYEPYSKALAKEYLEGAEKVGPDTCWRDDSTDYV
ncbi:hypothetical protein BDF20DRAFT_991035 [Mycotypha africana]|uniref:uncharacterized protein n=1 Tax=Mycotypha africana TaxID=64632 RepID=UPI002300F4EC|nr:uncharacterized protein BDF20DRAFT_991035 [Mycotypha africana]KAI8969243.1 hypothetical protein BDF20DRAFT_991035 [Mycotypha africana]